MQVQPGPVIESSVHVQSMVRTAEADRARTVHKVDGPEKSAPLLSAALLPPLDDVDEDPDEVAVDSGMLYCLRIMSAACSARP